MIMHKLIKSESLSICLASGVEFGTLAKKERVIVSCFLLLRFQNLVFLISKIKL